MGHQRLRSNPRRRGTRSFTRHASNLGSRFRGSERGWDTNVSAHPREGGEPDLSRAMRRIWAPAFAGVSGDGTLTSPRNPAEVTNQENSAQAFTSRRASGEA